MRYGSANPYKNIRNQVGFEIEIYKSSMKVLQWHFQTLTNEFF